MNAKTTERMKGHADRWQNPRLHKGRAHLLRLLLPLAALSLFLFACPLYNPAAFVQHGPDDVATLATQLTLAWDPPASGATQIVSYNVSYRAHGTTTWRPLGSVPASSQPSFTVLHSLVGNGSFDFAVSAVDSTGAVSPLHTSLDPTADPTSGWFLSWGE
jgi:hypothetical protein